MRSWTRDEDGKWRPRGADSARREDIVRKTLWRQVKTRTLASYLSPQLAKEDRKLMREAVRAPPTRFHFENGWGVVWECRPRPKDRWESHADDWWVYPVSPDPKRDQDVVTLVAKVQRIAWVWPDKMLKECAAELSQKDLAEVERLALNPAVVRLQRPDGTVRDYYRGGSHGFWEVFDGPTPNPAGIRPYPRRWPAHARWPDLYTFDARPRERARDQAKGESGGRAGAEKAAAQRLAKRVVGAGLNLKGQTRDAGDREL